MNTIQVTNENGKFAGTMSIDCKPATKVVKPYFNSDFELVLPAGWSESQLKKWLKSDNGKTAIAANKAAKQAAKQAANEVKQAQDEVSPVIVATIVLHTDEKKALTNEKRALTKEIKELQSYFDTINSLYEQQGKPLFFWYFGERKHSRIVYEIKKEIEALQAKRAKLELV